MLFNKLLSTEFLAALVRSVVAKQPELQYQDIKIVTHTIQRYICVYCIYSKISLSLPLLQYGRTPIHNISA